MGLFCLTIGHRRRAGCLHGAFEIKRLSLSGEIGRHSGLKIRRLPEKGRTGSIPVSGTSHLQHPVSYPLKTRMFRGIAGFLLSQANASEAMAAQQNTVTFDGIRRFTESETVNGQWHRPTPL